MIKQVGITTRSDAKESGTVVDQAVGAMGMIKKSPKHLLKIKPVFSDISFHTNLLALKAGDAWRGLAVVASEVRALSERSSQSTREVSALILTSSSRAAEGTKLIASAGDTEVVR
jgi:methyl-accepting chemotaxis protein